MNAELFLNKFNIKTLKEKSWADRLLLDIKPDTQMKLDQVRGLILARLMVNEDTLSSVNDFLSVFDEKMQIDVKEVLSLDL